MKIRTVIKLPGRAPAVMLMDNTLEAFQKFVGGYIETVTFAEDCVAICNEEGRIQGLPKNLKFLGVEFCGPIIVTAAEDGEFVSLTESQADKLIRMMRK